LVLQLCLTTSKSCLSDASKIFRSTIISTEISSTTETIIVTDITTVTAGVAKRADEQTPDFITVWEDEQLSSACSCFVTPAIGTTEIVVSSKTVYGKTVTADPRIKTFTKSSATTLMTTTTTTYLTMTTTTTSATATNLFTNGGFETGDTSGWSFGGPIAFYNRIITPGDQSSYALQMTSITQMTTDLSIELISSLTLPESTIYNMSFDYHIHFTAPAGCVIYIGQDVAFIPAVSPSNGWVNFQFQYQSTYLQTFKIIQSCETGSQTIDYDNFFITPA
jgi:hypothetical protein